MADWRLLELLQAIRGDPTNAGYLYLLTAYTPEEIESALNELGYGEQGKTDSSIQEG